MITVTALIIASLVLLTLFWGKIRLFYMDNVAPFVAKHCGSEAKKYCDDFFCFVNSGFSTIRRVGKALWQKFTSTVVHSEIVYTKSDTEHYQEVERTVIASGDGQCWLQEQSQNIHESRLPLAIRKQMYDLGGDTATVDVKEIIRHKYETQLIDEN